MLLSILSGWLYVEKRRLVQVFPEGVRKLWDDWELRVMVLISLTLQILLIVVGSRRKYKPGTWLRMFIWSAYLMADWVATVALGVLSNKQGNSCACAAIKTNPINEELMAFWAPFLLLHLGGPDTITAYALADNELWLRHLLGLGVQTGVALYVTVTAWSGTWLSFMTIPMLFSGVIKYGERSLALRSANREQFLDSLLDPPDAGPNYAKFMEEFTLKKEEGFTVLAIEVIEVADQSHAGSGDNNSTANKTKLLPDAHIFYQNFKRLFVDLILSFQVRDRSQSYFQNSTWDDAFTLVEMELGFGYDDFYTKAPILYTIWGCVCRFITFSFTIVVFVFFLIAETHIHRQIDLIITYILLVGAILLEFYAVILLLSSDRTKLWLSKLKLKLPENIPCFQPIISCFKAMVSRITSCFQPIISRVISCFKRPMASRITSCRQPIISRVISCFKRPMVSRLISYFGSIISLGSSCFCIICRLVSSFLPSKEQRWSNSLAQYNLLSFSLKDKPVPLLDDKPDLFQKIVKQTPIYKTFENRWYKNHCKLSDDLKRLIFQHFQKKSEVKKEKTEYGKYIASLCSARGSLVFEENGCCSSFKWSTEVEFDQSILIWHIATDLCYHADGGESLAAKDSSKKLSDYMLYLLVMCPFMLPIGIGMMRFRDTCEEAKEFAKEKGLSSKEKADLQNMLLRVSTEVPPTKVKGDRSKSVLFDACRLAHQLQKMAETEKKWDFVCNVWIEILGYAASHCRGYYHAQQLSMGGELLTHVWLLMAHLGITEQFQINRGHARAKLAVY